MLKLHGVMSALLLHKNEDEDDIGVDNRGPVQVVSSPLWCFQFGFSNVEMTVDSKQSSKSVPVVLVSFTHRVYHRIKIEPSCLRARHCKRQMKSADCTIHPSIHLFESGSKAHRTQNINEQ